jgi:hypothetical protein
MFYSYLHRRNDTGEVFYVGKGSGRRADSRSDRNRHWRAVDRKHGRTVEIVARWRTAQEAYDHEIFLIDTMRRLGHPLVNMTDGGEGGNGCRPDFKTRAQKAKSMREHWSQQGVRNKRMAAMSAADTRLKMSESSRAKWQRDEFRDHMTAVNRARAADPAFRVKVSASLRRLWEDEEYKSRSVAAMLAGRETPQARLNASTALSAKWQDPAYSSKLKAIHDTREFRDKMSGIASAANVKRSKPVLCLDTGVGYPSTLAASKALGVPQASISAVCRGVTKRAGGLAFQFIAPKSLPAAPSQPS